MVEKEEKPKEPTIEEEIRACLNPVVQAAMVFLGTQVKRGFAEQYEVQGWRRTVLEPNLANSIEAIKKLFDGKDKGKTETSKKVGKITPK